MSFAPPAVRNADTFCSLNLSTNRRYLRDDVKSNREEQASKPHQTRGNRIDSAQSQACTPLRIPPLPIFGSGPGARGRGALNLSVEHHIPRTRSLNRGPTQTTVLQFRTAHKLVTSKRTPRNDHKVLTWCASSVPYLDNSSKQPETYQIYSCKFAKVYLDACMSPKLRQTGRSVGYVCMFARCRRSSRVRHPRPTNGLDANFPGLPGEFFCSRSKHSLGFEWFSIYGPKRGQKLLTNSTFVQFLFCIHFSG